MRRLVFAVCLATLFVPIPSLAQQTPVPLRVVVAGLVHGHADGFFRQYLHRADLRIVGVAEADKSLFGRYAREFSLDPSLYSSDLDALLVKTNPQAVLAYTDTLDHRKVVEIAARHRVAVVMEKPLAVSNEDAQAIDRAARAANIPVIVNYETTWYRSNRAAYDLVHKGALGDIRKVVVHDGHSGPKEIGVGPEFLDWLTDPNRNGAGALFDFGCYGADLMTWLMDGKRPLSVTAVTQQIKPDIYPRVDDEATIVLTYPKAQAILQASWNWPFDRKDMEVYGRTGSVFTVRRDEIRVRREGEAGEQLVSLPPLAPPEDDPINYLRAVVLDGLKPSGLGSLETNLIVTEILDAARLSGSQHKTIMLK